VTTPFFELLTIKAILPKVMKFQSAKARKIRMSRRPALTEAEISGLRTLPPDELRAALAAIAPSRPGGGPTHSFVGRCRILAAILSNAGYVKTGPLAAAMGVSQGTLSTIAHCLSPKPGRTPRYQDVAQEFTRLGEPAFIAQYLDDETRDRLFEAMRDDPKPNPKANGYSIDNFGAFKLNGFHYGVSWDASDPMREPGWRIATGPDGPFHGREIELGQPSKPFATSEDAYKTIQRLAKDHKI
jgi:hypothetical protein